MNLHSSQSSGARPARRAGAATSSDAPRSARPGIPMFEAKWTEELIPLRSRVRKRRFARAALLVGAGAWLAIRVLNAVVGANIPEPSSFVSPLGLLLPWRWRVWQWLGIAAQDGDASVEQSGSSWLPAMLTAATCLVVSTVAPTVVGFAIMPGQQRVMELVRRALSNSFVRERGWASSPAAQRVLRGAEEHLHQRENMQRRLRARLGDASVELVPWVLRTPDGVDLEAAVLVGSGTPACTDVNAAASRAGQTPSSQSLSHDDTRTVAVLLNGNAQLWQTLNPSELASYARVVDAVVLVNYRGFGSSGGTMDMLGAVTDAAAAVQFASSGLGASVHNVVLVGHSIGGGLAGEVAEYYGPRGLSVCFDRTFTSIAAEAFALAAKLLGWTDVSVVGALARRPDADWWMRGGAAALEWLLEWPVGWNINPAAHLERVAGHVWMLWSQADAVIPAGARLRSAHLRGPGTVGPHGGVLQEEAVSIELTGGALRGDAHNAPLFGGDISSHLAQVQYALQRAALWRRN